MEDKRVTVTITNPLGFHARPAASFVACANKFAQCEVFVEKDEIQVNGKSIMGLMLFAAEQGSSMDIICRGEGADDCIAALVALVKDNFGEYEKATE